MRISRARHALEVITVGLPFCVFKILTGLLLAHRPPLLILGWLLIGLGGFDFIVNAINVAALLLGGSRALGICATQMLVARSWRSNTHPYDDIGTAIDVFLSFVLVAMVIGLGWLSGLARWSLQLWNVAVVLNVLGAGFARLTSSLDSLREGRDGLQK